MATRGTISVEFADGTIRGIYSHWDNYIDHNGKRLMESYANREMAEKLINCGDISSLSSDIEDCVFYHRDLGEALSVSYTYGSIDEYLLSHEGEDYDYLWTESDGWVVVDNGKVIKMTK